ncbi:50S ribosomal protein L11 methyltransferase [Helicobacter burdigaliensis]|uniref:50S ribosomal protein L11 methyltransferase n=1 Tax=Helicobacter burdigaliensis TaxID=2315334 RepID=UPI000EF74F8E|nr:50S ribosomal protein L11 methyltransferase [Helicobacter burdigaliensis]
MDTYYNCLIVHSSQHLEILEAKVMEMSDEAIEQIEGGFILRTQKDIPSIKKDLIFYINNLKELMQSDFEYSLEERKEKNQDWINEYCKSIAPIECGKLYIHPSWHEEKRDKINILIDPALAFGSGHHESTYGCLEVLQEIPLQDKKLLDVGCGSGILSIMAAKCGAKVWSCDTDEMAVLSTKDNASKNHIELQEVWEGSLDKITALQGSFDVVVANLLADIIVALPLQLYPKKEGVLILSGILNIYANKVLEKFKDFTILKQVEKGEWITFALKR